MYALICLKQYFVFKLYFISARLSKNIYPAKVKCKLNENIDAWHFKDQVLDIKIGLAIFFSLKCLYHFVFQVIFLRIWAVA